MCRVGWFPSSLDWIFADHGGGNKVYFAGTRWAVLCSSTTPHCFRRGVAKTPPWRLGAAAAVVAMWEIQNHSVLSSFKFGFLTSCICSLYLPPSFILKSLCFVGLHRYYISTRRQPFLHTLATPLPSLPSPFKVIIFSPKAVNSIWSPQTTTA
jgi:hypothetical protein